MNKEKIIQEFREFLNEEAKSKLTSKEVKYAINLAVEKNYEVSPIKSVTGNDKKITVLGKMTFSEKFIELLILELNKILETNFVKKDYIENVRISEYKLILVNK